MANKKQPKEQEKCWTVIGSNGTMESRPTLLSALELAKEYKMYNEEEEWYVFEITRSWVIDIGEPIVEEVELKFSELP